MASNRHVQPRSRIIDVGLERQTYVPYVAMRFGYPGIYNALTRTAVMLAAMCAVGVPHSVAQASSNKSTDARSEEETSRDAKTHFQQGQARFAAGKFKEAIKAFELAYHLLPAAELRFNIGRAYEELGDREAAIENFEAYLRDAENPGDAAAVRARVTRLRAEEADTQPGATAKSALSSRTQGGASMTSSSQAAESARDEKVQAPQTLAQLRSQQVAASLREGAAQGGSVSHFMPSGWFWVGVSLSGACLVSAATFAALPMNGDAVSATQASHRRIAAVSSLGVGLASAATATLIYLVEHGGWEERAP